MAMFDGMSQKHNIVMIFKIGIFFMTKIILLKSPMWITFRIYCKIYCIAIK